MLLLLDDLFLFLIVIRYLHQRVQLGTCLFGWDGQHHPHNADPCVHSRQYLQGVRQVVSDVFREQVVCLLLVVWIDQIHQDEVEDECTHPEAHEAGSAAQT